MGKSPTATLEYFDVTPEDVLIDLPFDLVQSPVIEDESFIRTLTVVSPRLALCSLEKVLKHADKEFLRISKLTGAKIVEHTWGLVPGKDPWRHDKKLPPAHRLAAKVSRIDPWDEKEANDEQVRQLQRGCDRYNTTAYTRKWGLSDISRGQFVFGTAINQGEPAFPSC